MDYDSSLFAGIKIHYSEVGIIRRSNSQTMLDNDDAEDSDSSSDCSVKAYFREQAEIIKSMNKQKKDALTKQAPITS